jgi:hypothetical protein
MHASVKLGLAFAASALGTLAYADSSISRTDETSARIEHQQTRARQTPDTSFGSRLQSQQGEENAKIPGMMGKPPGGLSGMLGPVLPDVGKTPTPGGPVPLPYPNTAPVLRTPLDTPAVVKVPLDRPLTRAEPLPVIKPEQVKTPKIESIGIKQK